ncbi:flavin reductase [Dictyobacter alpinus]|uniref:Flavin reductase n=1 Tax=Dictyobacter alpinus TaxID=2014873 RepID=A0A402BF64_9CHLR|nr:flavin reductase family protein [Dictyobacter alpinus]GCE30028.1 flavin reductase [Dictyobacter alpinus]
MGVDHSEFRLALSHFASGVTVITTQHQGQLHGTTVSSFCSLSLNPPLILVGIDLHATIHDLIIASEVFVVNILAEHAEDLSRHFARRTPEKFAGIAYTFGQLGVPLLDDALTTLECRLVARYPGGDHAIFVGEVVSTAIRPQHQPLLYYRSRYGHVQEVAVSQVNAPGLMTQEARRS